MLAPSADRRWTGRCSTGSPPTGRPVHVLLTKSDKLERARRGTGDARSVWREGPRAQWYACRATAQLFSSLKQTGRARRPSRRIAEAGMRQVDAHDKECPRL
ncbi:MAG: hypothetical protein MZW92_05190 [Comamonadaceae bacterium]|nr:hypothetical protein [Comamonadaceae bacterium]